LPFQQFYLPKLYSRVVGERISPPVPTPDGGWLVHSEHEPEVLRLDRWLNVVWRRDLQAQTEEYVPCQVAVSPDDQLMALSGRDSVRITDGAGTLLHTYSHPPWYGFCGTRCFFSPDSRYLWFATPGPPGDDDLLLVLETTGFTVVDRVSTQNRTSATSWA